MYKFSYAQRQELMAEWDKKHTRIGEIERQMEHLKRERVRLLRRKNYIKRVLDEDDLGVPA